MPELNTFLQRNQQYTQVIDLLSKRFATYGYARMKTAAFEKYDLYSHVTSSVKRQEMVKVIDTNGEVLVLRPDVTIPLTQELSHDRNELTREYRFFYIQEVFRQQVGQSMKTERTQAGVEYFSQCSPEADAEVIALAIQTMQDLGWQNITIELGHAAILNGLIEGLGFDEHNQNSLKSLIQAKNIVELRPFLASLSVDKTMIHAVEQIPTFYGKPHDVLQRAKQILTAPDMQQTIAYIEEVYRILVLYGLEDYLVIDFGLINDMDYYSGVLFQGYVERVGKPVLMGGRYDDLGKAFGAELPAIGFACDIESIVNALYANHAPQSLVDVTIFYEPDELAQAIEMATALRNRQIKVVSVPYTKERLQAENSTFTIHIREGKKTIHKNGSVEQFTSIEDFVQKGVFLWNS